MKIFGQIEKAQFENLTSDPTGAGLVTGRVWYRTDSKKLKAYDGTSVQEFVDLASSQTLLSKILGTPQVDDAAIFEHIATPANPSAGYSKIYPKTDGKFYSLSSAGVEVEIGTGVVTTKGDLYTYSTVPTRLPVGTNGQLLTADSTQATGLRYVSPLSTATASSIMYRDGNANTQINGLAENVIVTATSGGTTTINAGSPPIQRFTGTTTHTLVLPDATTMINGMHYIVMNRSTGNVTVNANGGGTLQIMRGSTQTVFTLIDNSTAAGTWDYIYLGSAGSQNTAGGRTRLFNSQTSGTQGGTATSGSWATLVLNTTEGVSMGLSSNQFTPPAGTYVVRARQPFNSTGLSACKIYNVTAAADVVISGNASVASSTGADATIIGYQFTANGTDAYDFRYRVATTQATFGLGFATSFGTETYSDIWLERIF